MASDEDYLSDLTDIESDDYDAKDKKPAKKAAWKVRKALTPARATTYSAQALYDQILACDINLEPEYQRDVVWPETKQIMIIDSIFRNFYIPPVIFAVKVHDDGAESKTCIDGKQRLTSIHRFMDGLIPHKDPLTGEKLWFKEGVTGTTKGAKRKMMPEKYRKVFANKQVVCVEYHEISEEDEREVFQRVQLGMALTPAEKLQVINTPRAVFVREVVSQFLREDGALGPDSLNWNTSRGSDFRCLGHAIHTMDSLTPKKCVLSDFSQVEKWLQGKNVVEKSFKDDVTETFNIFADMVSDNKHGKVFKKYKKVSPVEFVYTAVFIFVHKDANSLVQLASGVLDMFDHVRTAHRDVRMNNRVQKSYTTFITGWKSKKGVEDVGGGNKRKRITSTKKKKKKDTDDMDVDSDDDGDDDDDDYAAPKPKKKPSQMLRTATSASTSLLEKLTVIPSSGIKTEPAQVILPAQKTDRLAAIRKTKEAIAQNQAAQLQQNADPGSQATYSRPESFPSSKVASTTSANPQMLPSPAQAFAPPSALSHFPQGQSPIPPGWNPNGLPPPPGSSSSSADVPLWKQPPYNSNPNGLPNGLPSGPNDHSRGIPIPPTGSPIVSSFAQRDRERDRERDRDRRGSYDDRDRDSRRYEHHRRDSGGYRPRPLDDRDGWSGSRRR